LLTNACLVLIKLVAAWQFSYVVFLIFFFLQVYTSMPAPKH